MISTVGESGIAMSNVTNNYAQLPVHSNENKSNLTESISYVPFPFDLFRRSMCCLWGYKMEILSRSYVLRLNNNSNKLYYEDRADGWATSVKIGGFPFLPSPLVDIVTCSVKVHAVNVETGRYIHSLHRSPAMPLKTKSYKLKDVLSIPEWNECLIFDANYKDIVNEDTLLLFELFDDRPSLSTSKKNTFQLPRRVAWGYLFPIGNNRQLHAGILDEWDLNYKGIGINNQLKSTKIKLPTINETNDDTQNQTANSSHDSPRPIEYSISSGKESDKWKRIQLYHLINDDGTIGYIQRKIMGWPALNLSKYDIQHNDNLRFDNTDDMGYPDGIPSIYLQFRRQRHIPMRDGWLNIAIGPRRIDSAIGKTKTVHHIDSNNSTVGLPDDNSNSPTNTISPKHDKNRANILKRLRGSNELCVVPDRVLHRLQVGSEGAMVVQFSHSGHILAVASKSNLPNVGLMNYTNSNNLPGDVYSLRFFDTDDGNELWSNNVAHYGVIFSITWSKDDSYLLTCSNDGTSKVWDVVALHFHKVSHMTGGFLGIPVSTQNNNNALILAKIPHNHRYPYCIYTLMTSSIVHVYCGIFQEYSPALIPTGTLSELYNSYYQSSGERNASPRIITGSSDSKLRVWESGKFIDYIYVSNKTNNEDDKVFPHQGKIQAMVIDERSRYLITGDSVGDIYIWRPDKKGWYELLRKLRKDTSSNLSTKNLPKTKPSNQKQSSQKNEEISNSVANGIMSLCMHPDKTKSQLLIMQLNPSVLKVYNMINYKQVSQCSNFQPSIHHHNVFQRATFSADGRYIISCNVFHLESSQPHYHLNIHDVNTGTVVSNYHFAHPIRSISWHPKQHVIAIAMIGESAPVVVYSGVKEDADMISLKKNSDTIASFNQLGDTDTRNPLNQSLNFNNTIGSSRFTKILDETRVDRSLNSTTNTEIKDSTRLLKTEKTKEIIEKIKLARMSLDLNNLSKK